MLLILSASGSLLADDETVAFRSWVDKALLSNAGKPQPKAGLEVARQDYGTPQEMKEKGHGTLQLRQSIIQTPLKIGEQAFKHGLGTRTESVISVRLPSPAKVFSAQIGIDNNTTTKGKFGTAIFTVEAGGKKLFTSAVCRAGEAPVSVNLGLPGISTIVLRARWSDTTEILYSHADWADAKVTLENGKELFLDELPVDTGEVEFSDEIPFSFMYDGKSSADFLSGWKREVKSEAPSKGKERHVITYTDPETGLEVRCEATCFTERPAIDWVMYFKNNGNADTPILERILPMDFRLGLTKDVILHHSNGSYVNERDFLPIDENIKPKACVKLEPQGGRSSSGTLPFFNLEWNGGGLVGAIGWSGQWAFSLERDEGRQATLQAGQKTIHLKLHPGEQIRTPRILLVSWQGQDRLLGHNRLRRLLLDYYVPRVNGEIAIPPVAGMVGVGGQTEQNQKAPMPDMAEMGFETFWMDAGWYEGSVTSWNQGLGNWIPKKDAFPNGLRPVSDEAHKRGMKFLLWFEPERVMNDTRIAKEHPEWLMFSTKTKPEGNWTALYNLGNPDACAWLTDYISKCITDWGIDIYRQDFNMGPLGFWQAADAPDRQGMAENRYIEGLYNMWDELRKRHPNLTIDNCASGGQRIDLETISRSYTLSQSDTACCGESPPVWDQAQNAGLSLYVPLHSTLIQIKYLLCQYNIRSSATMGSCLFYGQIKEKEVIRKRFDEIKFLRPYYSGDYYPLFEINVNESAWCGWQYDRPDLGKGFVMCFRRAQSPYDRVALSLHGLDTNATYQVTNVDAGTKQTLTGAEMGKQFAVEIIEKPGTVLVVYEKVK